MVDTQYLIEVNEKIITGWNKKYLDDPQELGVRRPEINEVVPRVEEYDKPFMTLEDMVIKASYLMAVISWLQPFLDGNKRTGIVSSIKFLRDNGFDLDIEPGGTRELRNLLYEIQELRTDLDHAVVKKIIIYTTKRIINYESRR